MVQKVLRPTLYAMNVYCFFFDWSKRVKQSEYNLSNDADKRFSPINKPIYKKFPDTDNCCKKYVHKKWGAGLSNCCVK